MTETEFELPELDVTSLPGPESISRVELPNGIVVLVRENFHSPSVVLSGYLKVGSRDESPDFAGLSALTASSLTRGTKGSAFSEIYERIESIGARISVGSGKHNTGFSGKGLAEDLQVLLETLSEVLREPTFPQQQVERLKGEKLTALEIRDQDTSARAALAFNALVYPDHPYSVPTEGYRETVSQLTAEDLKGFHRQHYQPDGAVLSIVGAVEASRAVQLVERTLGDWHIGEAHQQLPLPPVEPMQDVLRSQVTLEGKSQSDLVMGSFGPARTDPEYLPALLGNNILGRFGLMGRIGDAVRDKAGLAYYAYSSLSGGLGPGPWQIMAGVNPADVEQAAQLIREEIRKFVEEPVGELELRENQANFIGRLPLQMESNEGVAGALVNIERYGLGLDYYQRFPDTVASFTPQEVQRASATYLHADRLAMAVAGPAPGEEG